MLAMTDNIKNWTEKLTKWIEAHHNFIVIGLFLMFFITGLLIYQDYGIAYDDFNQKQIGEYSVSYILDKDITLMSLPDRYYGPIFEIIPTLIVRIFKLTSDREVYLCRHFSIFIVFIISIVFFYRLCLLYFYKWIPALLACILLITSPRIFGNAFYNSKDIPFLSLFIICIYTLLVYRRKRKFYLLVIHSLFCGLIIDIRVVGIIIPIMTIFIVALDTLKGHTSIKKIIKTTCTLLLYLLFTAAFVYIFWPFLWADPIVRFIESIQLMSHYPYIREVFYLGKFYRADALPFHYLPYWLLMSNPPVYILGSIIGTIYLLTNAITRRTKPLELITSECTILLMWAYLPVLGVILINSSLYDGWRHMFFVYPAFIIIAVIGIIEVYNVIKSRLKLNQLTVICSLFLFMSILDPVYFMLKYHPHEGVYFNIFAGKNMRNIRYKFDMDYWRLSYKQALEYLLEYDNSPIIEIYSTSFGPYLGSLILEEEDRARLSFKIEPEVGSYYIGDYRWHPQDYSYTNKIYSLMVGNTDIISIFQLADE